MIPDRVGWAKYSWILTEQYYDNYRIRYVVKCSKCKEIKVLSAKERSKLTVCECSAVRHKVGRIIKDYKIMSKDDKDIYLKCDTCGKDRIISRSNFKSKVFKPCICTELSDRQVKRLFEARGIRV